MARQVLFLISIEGCQYSSLSLTWTPTLLHGQLTWQHLRKKHFGDLMFNLVFLCLKDHITALRTWYTGVLPRGDPPSVGANGVIPWHPLAKNIGPSSVQKPRSTCSAHLLTKDMMLLVIIHRFCMPVAMPVCLASNK